MGSYTSHTLRAATPADVASIAGIWYRGWLDAHLGRVPEALVAHRRPADFPALAGTRVPLTTVAVAEERVIGFVTVHDDEVEQIYVDAAAFDYAAETFVGRIPVPCRRYVKELAR